MRKHISFLILVLVLITQPLIAQPADNSENKPEIVTLSCDAATSSFTVEGTSSLHDWEMISESCIGKLKYTDNGGTIDIESITVKLDVTTLKSGKRIMDKKCYNALKHEDHPQITYTLRNIKGIDKESNNKHVATLNGTLDIAGVSKSVDIVVTMKSNGGKLNIQGSKPLKMSDFKVEPPTALLGTLKTGNEITIIFNLNFVVS